MAEHTTLSLAQTIVDLALSCGYESCGIIPLSDMQGYGAVLEERIRRTPENEKAYGGFRAFAAPESRFPWAKAIVICTRYYGKYRIPEGVEGQVAKYYLFDGRNDPESASNRESLRFEGLLQELGLQTATERKFGITAYRWAAHMAGLGIVRRNNFFYGPRGSWVSLEAFLIDQPLVYKVNAGHKPCPENCTRCQDACATKSLSAPYTMSRASCISCLTSWDGNDLDTSPHAANMGQWLYGCDLCQDACPFNKGKWEGREEFPGLSEASPLLNPLSILRMSEEELGEKIQPRFWYIRPDRLWKFKLNALNAMKNCYKEEYAPAIEKALEDDNERVRRMALWVKEAVK